MRLSLLFFLLSLSLSAQVYETQKDTIEIDSVAAVYDPYYREDQFYASISYNLLQGKPGDYSQYSFSTGLTVGFLRDIPLNEKRTHAIAAGLGYSYSNIKHNLVVGDEGDFNTYQIIPEGDFNKNKLVLHYLELPIELRWRNSDPISHKFWRIYLGFKISYLFYDKAQYEPDGDTTFKVRNDKNMNDFVYGTYLSIGWNTWNFYAYYGITPIYNSPPLSGSTEKVKMNAVNLGMIFYIL